MNPQFPPPQPPYPVGAPQPPFSGGAPHPSYPGIGQPQMTYPGGWPAYGPMPGMPASGRRSRRTLWIVLAAVGVSLAVGLTLVLALTSSRQVEMTIKFSLFDARSDCSGGTGGYSDIGPGNPFLVRDQDNKIIASTTLPAAGAEGRGCTWTMHVMVPADAEQYAVEGNRGTVSFSRQELEDNDWTAEVSLGD